MPVFVHLLKKQCVKTGHFTLAHCLGWVGGCLVWLLPLLLLTEVGATRGSQVWHETSRCGRFRLLLGQVIFAACDIEQFDGA